MTDYMFSVIIPLDGELADFRKSVDSVLEQTAKTVGRIQIIFIRKKDSSKALYETAEAYRHAYPGNILLEDQLEAKVIAGHYAALLQPGYSWKPCAAQALFEAAHNGFEDIHILIHCGKKKGTDAKDFAYFINEPAVVCSEPCAYVIARKYADYIWPLCTAMDSLDVLKTGFLLFRDAGTFMEVDFLEKSAAETSSPSDKNFYLKRLPEFAETVRDLETEHFKLHVEYLIMSVIISAMKTNVQSLLDTTEYEEFKLWVKTQLQGIDDFAINQASPNSALRYRSFCWKYGYDIMPRVQFWQNKLTFHNLVIYNFNSGNICKIIQKKQIDGILTIRLKILNTVDDGKFQYMILDNNAGTYDLTFVKETNKKIFCFGEKAAAEKVYQTQIPAAGLQYPLRVYYCYDQNHTGCLLEEL